MRLAVPVSRGVEWVVRAGSMGISLFVPASASGSSWLGGCWLPPLPCPLFPPRPLPGVSQDAAAASRLWPALDLVPAIVGVVLPKKKKRVGN